jgi:predicted enzyme related to lactoylglutathione lyase
MLTPGTPACNTAPIAPVFAPTGWKTVALEQITIGVADYRQEASFYSRLMGWTIRDVDGARALMDVGNWGSVIFKQGASRGAVVESFGFVIEPWNASKVEPN